MEIVIFRVVYCCVYHITIRVYMYLLCPLPKIFPDLFPTEQSKNPGREIWILSWSNPPMHICVAKTAIL